MAENTLLEQGVSLMLYGMSTVFLFLALLVIAMTAMSYLLARFAPPGGSDSATPAAASNELDGAVVAAITAALHQHRQRHDPRQRP